MPGLRPAPRILNLLLACKERCHLASPTRSISSSTISGSYANRISGPDEWSTVFSGSLANSSSCRLRVDLLKMYETLSSSNLTVFRISFIFTSNDDSRMPRSTGPIARKHALTTATLTSTELHTSIPTKCPASNQHFQPRGCVANRKPHKQRLPF